MTVKNCIVHCGIQEPELVEAHIVSFGGYINGFINHADWDSTAIDCDMPEDKIAAFIEDTHEEGITVTEVKDEDC